jgi:hypothetical protein
MTDDEDRTIAMAALADPDAQPPDEKQLDQMRPMSRRAYHEVAGASQGFCMMSP